MNYTKTSATIKVALMATVFIISSAVSAFAQTGCTDPLANNYNSSATVNDGSCTYNTTTYTPLIKVNPLNSILMETSGLQWAGNSLWSFNDGGGAAAIYRIDTLTNTIFQTVNLAGATNVDWEDIAFDGTYFYVGDFGNNATGARTDLKIYKFPISAIPDYTANANVTIAASQIETINFNYIDQLPPLVDSAANHTKFDCEAMIVDGGKIHLFTKNWIDANSTHYVIPSTLAGTYAATPLETLATNYLVTGADKAPGQNLVVLLGYQASGTASHFMHLLYGYSAGNYFNGNKRKLNLPDVFTMGQAEGITFRNNTYGYISNERVSSVITVSEKLKSFDISNYITQSVLALQLKYFTVTDVNGAHKLAWNFASPVNNLQLQQSNNGSSFTTLKTYKTSTADVFYNKEVSATNYYRLAWQKTSGGLEYSKTISLKSNENNQINNLRLTTNGVLSFKLNSSETNNYSFKITSADGKILSISNIPTLSVGINTIKTDKNFAANNLLFITVYHNNLKTTQSVRVEN